jgi:hypothetical protein
MSIIRSYFDGVGTGAGVAWPSFGIMASVLSVGVGGTLAITLGTICCLIFLAVSIPVFYLSYKKISLEEKQLNNKVNLKLMTFIDNHYQNYLNTAYQDNQRFPDYLNSWGLSDPQTMQDNLLAHINNSDVGFFSNYHNFSTTEKKKKLAAFIHAHIASIKNIPSPTFNELASTAFLNFVGVFGSIAGCSAGVMGVISGLGIISGFGAIPLVGAAVLMIAIGLGIYSGIYATQSMIEKNKKTKMYKDFKRFNNQFEINELSNVEKSGADSGARKHLTESAVYHSVSSGALFTTTNERTTGHQVNLLRTPMHSMMLR